MQMGVQLWLPPQFPALQRIAAEQIALQWTTHFIDICMLDGSYSNVLRPGHTGTPLSCPSSQHHILSYCDFMLLNMSDLIFHYHNCQLNCYWSLRRGSTHCTTLHHYVLQAQVQFSLRGT